MLTTISNDDLTMACGGKDKYVGIAASYGGPNGLAYGTMPNQGGAQPTPFNPAAKCTSFGGPNGCAFLK